MATELIEELGAVARNRDVRRPMLAVWGHRMLLGAGFVVLVLIADRNYGLEAPGYGVALAVTGVGSFGGTALAPVLGRAYRPGRIMVGAYLAGGALAAIAAGWPELAVLFVCLGLISFAFQVLKVVADAQIQRGAADEVRGRVFALYDVAYNLAFVLAGVAVAPLWSPGRASALLAGVAVGYGIGALVILLTRGGGRMTPAHARA